MEEKDLVVTQETIDSFLKYRRQHSRRENIVMALWAILAVVVFCMLCYADGNPAIVPVNGRTALKAGWLLDALALIALGGRIATSEKFNHLFDVIEKWEKLTHWPAKEFPVSMVAKRLLKPWAAEMLEQAAERATAAFIHQDNIRHGEYPNTPVGGFNPATAAAAAKLMAQADRDAKEIHGEYLALWDLLTAKGIGILKGEVWSDPEVFRARCTTTCERK